MTSATRQQLVADLVRDEGEELSAYRPCVAPATPESRHQRSVIDPSLGRGLCGRHTHSVYRQDSISAGVVHLFAPRRPSAIVRRIAAIIVDSFNAVAWRAWTHVFEERGEIRSPFRTHGDSSTTVAFPVANGRIFAALDRVLPRHVLFGSCPAVCAPTVGSEASAPVGLSASKDVTVHDLGVAAVATAHPERSFSLAIRLGDHEESAYPSPRHIYRSRMHVFILTPFNLGMRP